MRAFAIGLLALALACGGKKDDEKKGSGEASAKGGSDKSKGSDEAKANLERISKGAKTYYIENAKFPPSAPLTPATPCCKGKDGLCAPDAAIWSGPGWKDVDFSIDEPHRYQYELVSDGQTFKARAVGDLDCDTTLATFEIASTANAEGTIEMSVSAEAPNE